MDADEARRLRMASLLLVRRTARTALEVVTWFGALQAQDLASGKWSLGARIPGCTEADVDAALEAGEVLRTWPMRGTIHLVPSGDAGWMLEHVGSRQLDGVRRRWENLGLDGPTVRQAADVLGDALAGGGRLARPDALATLEKAGIDTAGQRGYHFLWYASQVGVTCIGPNEGKQQTFVRLDEWAPDQRKLDRDEALAELATRYFRSHGPATRADFAGWLGVGAKEARTGIDGAGDGLVTCEVEGVQHWMAASLADEAASVPAAGWLLLPGFDEFVLGYKDRRHIVADDVKDRLVPGGNGMFRPTVVLDGRVVGTWTRAAKRASTVVALAPFPGVPGGRRSLVAALGPALEEYARYLGQPVTAQLV